MATRTEVKDANLNCIDANALDVQIANLTDLNANGAGFNMIITADSGSTEVFNLDNVVGNLRTATDDAIMVTLLAALDATVAAVIGADDITANTLRKAINDAIVSFDVNIAAT